MAFGEAVEIAHGREPLRVGAVMSASGPALRLPYFARLLQLISRWLDTPPTPPQTQNLPPQSDETTEVDLSRIRVYNEAFAAIGKDLSQTAPDERGCAESLSRILCNVYPNFPIFISTIALYRFLARSTYFELTAKPTTGCIAIFSTEGNSIGHCGVWGEKWVMSNTSATGKWEANYTHAAWLAAARKRGLPNFFFIPL